MKNTLIISTLVIGLFGCNNPKADEFADSIHADSSNTKNADKTNNETSKRFLFKSLNQVSNQGLNSIWVNKKDSSFSLALHFQYKDTLSVSYSPECWLRYPFKTYNNKIIVYWDNYIDTKYNFDIVKVVNQLDTKYIGKPFMALELKNDTTLKATYLIKELVEKINNSSKDRKFFPNNFYVVQDGELYD